MKQLYLFVLAAILALGASFQAKAYTCHFEWDTPGAIKIVQTAGKTSVPLNDVNGTTSFDYDGDLVRLYIQLTDGENYKMTQVAATNADGNTYNLNISNSANFGGQYVMLMMTAYGGGSVKITTESTAMELDGTLNVNVINGASNIYFQFGGSDREITLKDGQNEVPFSTAKETTIKKIQLKAYNATKPYYNDPYVIVDGEKQIFADYGYPVEDPENTYWLNTEDIAIHNGSQVEIKLGEDKEAPTTAKVSVTLEDEFATAAVGMIYNVTQKMSVPKATWSNFEVNKGDEIRFSMLKDDYIVTIKKDGVVIPASTYTVNGNYNLCVVKIDADTQISISAKEKEYGTVQLKAYINGIEGIDFFYGAANGTKLDETAYTAGQTITWTKNNTEYTEYTFTVSAKTPKIFFEPKEGYWFVGEGVESKNGGKTFAIVSEEETDAGMISSTQLCYLYAQKINKTEKIAVYFTGPTERLNAALKDSGDHKGSDRYTLTNGGYTVIDFDPEYNNPFEAVSYDEVGTGDDIIAAEVYLNDEQQKLDTEANSNAVMTLKNGDVIRIHTAPVAKHALNVSISGKSSKVIYDKFREYVPNASQTLSVYEGAEITVVPGKDSKVMVDGEDVTLAADGTYTFNVSKAHSIAVVYTGTANVAVTSPANGEKIAEFNGITVKFPEAESVKFVGNTDEITMMAADGNWAPGGIDPLKVEKIDNQSFLISFKNADATVNYQGDIKVFIPEGAFEINGELYNGDTTVIFTYEKNVDEIPMMVSPYEPRPASELSWGAMIAFGTFTMTQWGPDPIEIYPISGFTADKYSKIKVSFNDEPLSYDSAKEPADNTFSVAFENNMIMINTTLGNKGGELKVEIPEGLFNVSSKPVPAISHVFEFFSEKTFTHELWHPTGADVKDGKAVVRDINSISFIFDGPENASVYKANGISIRDAEYNYQATGKITKKENVQKIVTRAEATAPHHFEVTFDNAPSEPGEYTLNVEAGTFKLDGQPYPAERLTQAVVVDPATGVISIFGDANATVTVMTIDGKVIFRDAPASEINTLAPGIYIVNGKKVVKK